MKLGAAFAHLCAVSCCSYTLGRGVMTILHPTSEYHLAVAALVLIVPVAGIYQAVKSALDDYGA